MTAPSQTPAGLGIEERCARQVKGNRRAFAEGNVTGFESAGDLRIAKAKDHVTIGAGRLDEQLGERNHAASIRAVCGGRSDILGTNAEEDTLTRSQRAKP